MTNQSAVVPTGTESELRSAWNESRLVKFWEAMTQMYGSEWKRQHGDSMPQLWRATLESMTPEEASLGFHACRTSGDTRPCTLPQFTRRVSDALKAGKPAGTYLGQREDEKTRLAHAQAAERAVKELPPPDTERLARLKSAEHAGKAAVSEMRRILNND